MPEEVFGTPVPSQVPPVVEPGAPNPNPVPPVEEPISTVPPAEPQ